jgi:hypothetical protein
MSVIGVIAIEPLPGHARSGQSVRPRKLLQPVRLADRILRIPFRLDVYRFDDTQAARVAA